MRSLAREAELLVQAVCVCRVQDPAPPGVRTLFDREPHELDAEAAAAVLGEDVDVCEIHEPRVGGVDRAGVADLRAVRRVEADIARRALDQPIHHVAATPGRPVGLLGDEPVDRLAVDPARVVVELVAAWRAASSHRERPQAEATLVLVRGAYDRERLAGATPSAQPRRRRRAESRRASGSPGRPRTRARSSLDRSRGRRRRRPPADSRRALRPRRTRRSSRGAACSRTPTAASAGTRGRAGRAPAVREPASGSRRAGRGSGSAR